MCTDIFACMDVCVQHCKFSACRDQKSMLGPLEPELQIVGNHHVSVGNQTRPSGRAISAHNCGAISSVPNADVSWELLTHMH